MAESVGTSMLVYSERDLLRASPVPIVISDSDASDVEITSDTVAEPEAQRRESQREPQRKKRPTLEIDLASPPRSKRSRLQRTARPSKVAPVVVELDCDYEIPGESSDMHSYECPVCYESCRRSKNVLSGSRCKAYEKVHAHCTLQRQCPSCGGSLTTFTKAKKDLLGVDVIEIPDSPPAPKSSSNVAPKSTTRPFFAIQLPEHVLAMIVSLLLGVKPATAEADAKSLYAGVMGKIGSVCKAWRGPVKRVLMGDDLAWLSVRGTAEAAKCLSSFPHPLSLRIVGDAAAESLAVLLGSTSVARLALKDNGAVRDCRGISQA